MNELLRGAVFSPDGIPVVCGADTVPKGLSPFHLGGDGFAHFFTSDRRFERVWNNPDRYIKKLSMFSGVIGTDFSYYLDMPKAAGVYNVFRSRVLDFYFQKHGLTVIPAVTWAGEDSFDPCFGCIMKGSSVAISTNGCENRVSKKYFEAGYREMVRRIEPRFIVLYGPRFDFMTEGNIFEYESYLQSMRKRLK